MNHLVDDLYQLSLSDVGGLRYNFTPLNLSSCLESLLVSLQQQAHGKGLDLIFNIQKDVWVNADLQRLEQLILNLCNNAFAYTDSPGKIELKLTAHQEQVSLSIDDSYPSVAAQDCELLFDPLYRQDLSRTRRESGAGLGLTICKNIVEAHGGGIQASPSSLGGLQIMIKLKSVVGVSQ